MSFQTSTSGSELVWTRQEALCHEPRASSPVLGYISHQECNWWAQAAPGFPSLPGTPVSLPGLGSSFHQLCSAQFAVCCLGNLPGHSSCPFPTFPVGPGNKLSPNVLHLSVLQPDSCLCFPSFSGINGLRVSALCPVAGLAAVPGLQLTGKGREGKLLAQDHEVMNEALFSLKHSEAADCGTWKGRCVQGRLRAGCVGTPRGSWSKCLETLPSRNPSSAETLGRIRTLLLEYHCAPFYFPSWSFGEHSHLWGD